MPFIVSKIGSDFFDNLSQTVPSFDFYRDPSTLLYIPLAVVMALLPDYAMLAIETLRSFCDSSSKEASEHEISIP